jgi:transposase
MGMEKEDARKQSREVLHERRKQVIRLHRKGMPVMQIVEHSGLSWCAVNAAIRAYATAGAAALKPACAARKQGSGRC